MASSIMTCAVLARESPDPTFGRRRAPPHGPAPTGSRLTGGLLRDTAGVGSGHPPRDRGLSPQYVGHPARWSHRPVVRPGRGAGRRSDADTDVAQGDLSATDMVLHYLAPARVGPVEGPVHGDGSRTRRPRVVRVAMHDAGVDDRMVALASVTVSPL